MFATRTLNLELVLYGRVIYGGSTDCSLSLTIASVLISPGREFPVTLSYLGGAFTGFPHILDLASHDLD